MDNARSVKGNVYLGTYIEIDTHIHRVTLGNHSDEDSNMSPQIQKLIPNMGETVRKTLRSIDKTMTNILHINLSGFTLN